MGRNTKKIILLATSALIAIAVLSFFYTVSTIRDFEARSGDNYFKMNPIQNGGTKVYKWDIGIHKNNTKKGIVENESNSMFLQKFSDTVTSISNKRYQIFLGIIYLLFILFVFATARKDSQIYSGEKNKRTLQMITILLVIFLIYKISFNFIELNGLYKDINYYFMRIS